jgi:NADPH:quinone reductase-like Zn-dependent oxidoreductase
MYKTKEVLITEFGETKLAVVEAEIAEPAAGEVQVAVEYSVVSGSDVNVRRGTYPFQKKAPLTPGYSVIGKVRLNGKGCSEFEVFFPLSVPRTGPEIVGITVCGNSKPKTLLRVARLICPTVFTLGK